MISPDLDLRLPFDRPWREAVAIYANSLWHFAIALLLGCVPILLCFVWIHGGVPTFSAAVALALGAAALSLVIWRRLHRPEVRLERMVQAAEECWAIAGRGELRGKSGAAVIASGTSHEVKGIVRSVKFYGGGDFVPMTPKIYIDADLITLDQLNEMCVRLDALRPRLDVFTRNVEAHRAFHGPMPARFVIGVTLMKVARSQARSWNRTVDALHRYHTLRQEPTGNLPNEEFGRGIKEMAVLETVQFARTLEFTGHWFLRFQDVLSAPEDVEEENLFAVRE